MHHVKSHLAVLCAALFVSTTVFSQTLSSLTVIAPPAPLVAGGNCGTFTATGIYTSNASGSGAAPIPITGGLSWKSDDPTTLAIDPSSAIATCIKEGVALVRAYDPSTGRDWYLSVTVMAGPDLISFSVPPVITVPINSKSTIYVTGTYGPSDKPVIKPIDPKKVKFMTPAGASSIATIDPTTGIITGVSTTSSPTQVDVVVSNSKGDLPKQTISINVIAPPAAPTPPAVPLAFSGPLYDQSKTVLINGTVGDTISLFLAKNSATPCGPNTAETPLLFAATASGAATASSIILAKLSGSLAPPYVINLALPLEKDSLVCAEDTTSTPPQWTNLPATVVDAQKTLATPVIEGSVYSDSKSLTISNAAANDTIVVYEYDPGTDRAVPPDPKGNCATWPAANRTILQIMSGTSTAASYVLPAATSVGQTYPITLSQGVLPGYILCVAETAAGFSPSFSAPVTVKDANAFGRFRTYFLVGLQASNQQTNNSSSTVGEYLEAGFNSTFVRAKDQWEYRADTGNSNPNTRKFRPGLATNVDVRLSPIPVAATTTTTNTTVSNSLTTSVTPSVLSSQQAIRFVGNISSPFKTTSWNKHTDSFTVAPTARGGFGTLLNPSTATASSSASGTAPTSVSSTNYSSAYYFWGLGARVAWDKYSGDSDESPITIAQFLVTYGEFSNLPSYVCKAAPAGTTNPYATATITTACNQGTYAPSTNTATPPVTTNLFLDSRTLIPRLDMEGLVKLPGYPFVLGVDANLQQNTMFRKNNLDYLNKPGNDIRVFIGISINPATFFSKAGAPSF